MKDKDFETKTQISMTGYNLIISLSPHLYSYQRIGIE